MLTPLLKVSSPSQILLLPTAGGPKVWVIRPWTGSQPRRSHLSCQTPTEDVGGLWTRHHPPSDHGKRNRTNRQTKIIQHRGEGGGRKGSRRLVSRIPTYKQMYTVQRQGSLVYTHKLRPLTQTKNLIHLDGLWEVGRTPVHVIILKCILFRHG